MITLLNLAAYLPVTEILITVSTLIYMTIIMMVLKIFQYNREDDSASQP